MKKHKFLTAKENLIMDSNNKNNKKKEPKINPFTVLGLDRSADQDTIKKAYRKAAINTHPDKVLDEEAKKRAEEVFKQVVEAYKILTDETLRSEYEENADDDDTPLENVAGFLNIGKTMSEDFKILLTKWMAEALHYEFIDNITDEMETVLNEIVKPALMKIPVHVSSTTKYKCSDCNCVYPTKESHDDIFIGSYISIFESVDQTPIQKQMIELLANKSTDWNKVSYQPLKEFLNFMSNHIKAAKNISYEFNKQIAEMNLNVLPNFMDCIERTEDCLTIEKILSAKEDDCFDNVITNMDCSKIKKLIEEKKNSESQIFGFMRSIESKRVKSGSYDILNGIDRYVSIVPKIFIEEGPTLIPHGDRKNCHCCKTEFGLFLWKYNCRMCGEIFCANCLLNSIAPKLGYNFDVMVCKSCKYNIDYYDSMVWLNNAKRNDQNDEAAKMIYISSLYHENDKTLNDQIENLGNYFIGRGEYKLGIHCYQTAHASLDKWFELVVMLVLLKKYNLALTCINKIRTLHKPSNDALIKQGNKYLDMSMKHGYFESIFVAFFFFDNGRVSYQDFCKKIHDLHKKQLMEHRNLCLNYLLIRYKNKRNELDAIAQIFFGLQIFDIAIFFFHKSSYTLDKWTTIVNDLCTKNQYQLSLHIWDNVIKKFKVNVTDFSSKYLFVKYLHLFLTNEITLDNIVIELSNAISKKSDSESKIALSFIISLFKDQLNKQTELYIQNKEYDKIYLCYRISQLLEQNMGNWVDLGNKLLELNHTVAAFQCYDYANVEWKELGDDFFMKRRYTSALNCYLLSEDVSIDKHIFNKAQILIQLHNLPKAFIYFRKLVEKNKLIYEIIKELGKCISSDSVFNDKFKNLILSYLKSESNIFDKKYVIIHDNLSKLLEFEDFTHNIKKIIGALHVISKYDTSTYCKDKLAKFTKIHEINESKSYYKQLLENVYSGNSKEVALMVLDLNEYKLNVVKQLYAEQVGGRDITILSDHYRCIMYLLRAAINIYEYKHIDALHDLQASLICFPVKEHPEAISILLRSDNLQMEIYRHFIRGLMQMNGSKTIKIETPAVDQFQELLKGSKMLTMIKKFERAINNRIENHEEAALLYMDLCMVVGDGAGLAGCFMMSALHFMEALHETTNWSKAYAYRNAVFHMCVNAYEISHRHLTPTMQIHIDKQIVSLIINSNKILSTMQEMSKESNNNAITHCSSVKRRGLNDIGKPISRLLIGTGETFILTTIMQNMVNLARVSPIIELPVVLSCDTIYIDLAARNYTEHYLNDLAKNGSSLCPNYLADYYLLEGSWKHWFTNETDDFNAYRQKSMESLLASNGWNMSDVQFLMGWPLFPKDKNGWINPKKNSLNFTTKSFKRIHGIQLNKTTGAFSYLLEDAKEGQGLFTFDDINTVLVLGIQSALFTLDQPDTSMQSHPFQEMKYYPKQLAGTDYLATLLHTDYLLKMLSMGIDVSSNMPFEFRDINEGFINKLPEYLREAIKPIHQRENCTSHGTAHRFWIEAGELVYDTDENDTMVTWKFADIKMKVKKHLLKYDEFGKLIDDENDVEDDNSAEAEFAKNFTKYYEHIGVFFPELLRLKELLKLGGVLTILRSMYHNTKESMSTINVDSSFIKKNLSNLSSQIKEYPLYTESNVSSAYYDVLRANGLSDDSRVAYSEISRTKDNIRSQLREADENILNQVTKILAEGYHCSEYDIHSTVKSWLQYRSSYADTLANKLAEGVRNYIISQKRKILNGITALNVDINIDKVENVSLGNNGECPWVPAAFFNNIISEHKNIKVYGGVNLGLNMRNGSVGGGGGYGSYGGNGGNSSGGGRYVERMGADGKVWGTCTNSNGAVAWTGYKATNPNNVTQQYFRPMTGGPTDHTTLHRDGTYNVHHTNGTKSVYK
ncbi:hypothetical protein QJ857_gp0090 [Tupanvirus soda lake]|uniref:J domain-containing protein n=2 Tax=Tupanvirus TaxID=2094720 RepID=A0A6N1NXY0_9VIRU|nr:hypothetical protein QJ857_gp0090 [Tupanvirus soda lake]QKU35933.1 hypothetical protein [Tupanvirus soda lake]